jgi:tetratricopeptide (TPR) repeat protein
MLPYRRAIDQFAIRACARTITAAAVLLGCLTLHAQVSVLASEPTRAQALKALDQPSAQARLAAVVRLAEVGTMLDADRVARRLHDDDAQVRRVAGAALWQIWSRSGNKTIDSQYQRGVQLMASAQLKEAVQAFTDIIKKQPAFAEAWNKRATLYFMLGEYQLSLSDCDEVLKRNRHHFGALSGYAQIYTEMGDFKRALSYFEQALKVNPSLPNAASTLQFLQDKVAQKERNTV